MIVSKESNISFRVPGGAISNHRFTFSKGDRFTDRSTVPVDSLAARGRTQRFGEGCCWDLGAGQQSMEL